jgi:hypothetical protein
VLLEKLLVVQRVEKFHNYNTELSFEVRMKLSGDIMRLTFHHTS